MEGRPRRPDRQLPKRFRDVVPQALPPLPSVSQGRQAPSTPSPPTAPVSTTCSPEIPPPPSRIRRLFRSPRNIFRLFRQFYSERVTSHDPEENLTPQGLLDGKEATNDNLAQSPDEPSFHPYPNTSSFLLGDWYWNNGAQKSQESFRQLLNIVGHPDFHPGDVSHTRWDKINKKLASNDFDKDHAHDGGEEWLDEDAGWKQTPIRISAPFHKRSRIPGPKNYVVGDLYHRSLISVIREKLTNPSDAPHFHYEPFELFWSPSDDSPDIRVHGKLYSSPAFIDAHNALQESPGEPGCDLPRVVVSMMFWSDATHLTTFGNAKLWPCYLYFGNESKYRHCKPSCKLCNHVAYFQTVRNTSSIGHNRCGLTPHSFLMLSRTLPLNVHMGKGPPKLS